MFITLFSSTVFVLLDYDPSTDSFQMAFSTTRTLDNPKQTRRNSSIQNVIIKAFLLNNVRQSGILSGNQDVVDYHNDQQQKRERINTAVRENDLASLRTKGRKSMVTQTVKQNRHALKYASVPLQSDKEIVLGAVRKCGYALEYALELRGDKEIVLVAVRKCGLALQFASDGLKDDKEVVLRAVEQDGLALVFASTPLKGDKSVVLTAVSDYGCALEAASEALRGDLEVALAAVQQDGNALEYVSHFLKNNRAVVTAAVRQNGLAIRWTSGELKGDVDIVREAVEQNPLVLDYMFPRSGKR